MQIVELDVGIDISCILEYDKNDVTFYIIIVEITNNLWSQMMSHYKGLRTSGIVNKCIYENSCFIDVR